MLAMVAEFDVIKLINFRRCRSVWKEVEIENAIRHFRTNASRIERMIWTFGLSA